MSRRSRRDGGNEPGENSKQLLPGLLVDSAGNHLEKELFRWGVALGK